MRLRREVLCILVLVLSVLSVGFLIVGSYSASLSKKLSFVPESATLSVGMEQLFTVRGDGDHLDFDFFESGTEETAIVLIKVAHNQVIVRVVRSYDYPISSPVKLTASSTSRDEWSNFKQATATIHAVR